MSLRLIVSASVAVLTFCTPSRDTVMKDVERNYAATGFLDTDTFQIRCPISAGTDTLAECKSQLVQGLVAFKEAYDRAAHARRNHPDFQPFLKPVVPTEEQKVVWVAYYESLSRDRARLVYESRAGGGDSFEGIYRLRQKDLIYRVQNPQ